MKFLAVILSVLTLAFVSANSSGVKIYAKNDTMIAESKIAGGVGIDISYHPSQVAIILRNIMFCSGNIIKPKIVLTVAHCLVFKNIPQLQIRSGSNYYANGGRVVNVERAKTHPNYRYREGFYNFDIGILFLVDSAIAMGIAADIIVLWNADTFFTPGTLATVAGWGAVEEGGMTSDILRVVVVPVVPSYACRFYGPDVPSYNICAGYSEGRKDTCKGDSGAGLVINTKLAGITAFGQCGKPNSPAGYTSIPIFRHWIWEQVNV